MEALEAIRADAESVRRLIEACRTGALSLLSSEALQAEIRRAPERVRLVSESVLSVAVNVIAAADTREAAKRLQTLGLREMDTLHLAAAYTGRADYFITGDEHFLRRAPFLSRNMEPGPVIVSPVECVQREGL